MAAGTATSSSGNAAAAVGPSARDAVRGPRQWSWRDPHLQPPGLQRRGKSITGWKPFLYNQGLLVEEKHIY